MDTSLQEISYFKPSGVFLVLVTTAVLTLYYLRPEHVSKTKISAGTIPQLPTLILIEGFLLSQLIIAGGIFRKLSFIFRRDRDAFYGASSIHRVVYGEPVATELLRKPLHTVNNIPLQWHLTVRVFGANPDGQILFSEALNELNQIISRSMSQESTVRQILANALAFTADSVSQLVPTGESKSMDGYEAEMFHLIRNLTGHVTIASLFGLDFMHKNPDILTNLWKLDSAFTALAMGVPDWLPISLIKNAKDSREKIKKCLNSFHARVDDAFFNSESDEVYQRLTDVSPLVRSRCEVMRKYNFDADTKASYNLALMWASSGNTTNFVFWLIAYIYSYPGLLLDIRGEIDSYVSVSSDGTRILSISWEPIVNSCPLLKSAYLETFRMVHEPTSVRYLSRSVKLKDASSAETSLAAGTYLTVPHMIHQRDPNLFPQPELFKPERFLSKTKGDNGETRTIVQYGSLKPWGDGSSMCRGRVFAEREVLTLVASIVTLWDMAPVLDTWKLPGKKAGTGVCPPNKDMVVRVSRRLGSVNIL